MIGDRIYCPLAGCLPRPLDGQPINNEHVRESRSFATFEGYMRHLEFGHFIHKNNAPMPYCLDEEDFPANFALDTKGP